MIARKYDRVKKGWHNAKRVTHPIIHTGGHKTCVSCKDIYTAYECFKCAETPSHCPECHKELAHGKASLRPAIVF